MEHVAEWIGRWTQDQKVWDLVPYVGHVVKCLAAFQFRAASGHPAVMGTWSTNPKLDQYLQAAVGTHCQGVNGKWLVDYPSYMFRS